MPGIHLLQVVVLNIYCCLVNFDCHGRQKGQILDVKDKRRYYMVAA